MEDIKQNITDNQYKIIMDSLMEIHKTKERKNDNQGQEDFCKFFFFYWSNDEKEGEKERERQTSQW